MTRSDAEKLMESFLRVASGLNEATLHTMQFADSSEANRYRSVIAEMLSVLNERGINPLGEMFPDLHPDRDEAWYSARPQPS